MIDFQLRFQDRPHHTFRAAGADRFVGRHPAEIDEAKKFLQGAGVHAPVELIEMAALFIAADLPLVVSGDADLVAIEIARKAVTAVAHEADAATLFKVTVVTPNQTLRVQWADWPSRYPMESTSSMVPHLLKTLNKRVAYPEDAPVVRRLVQEFLSGRRDEIKRSDIVQLRVSDKGEITVSITPG